MYMKKQILFMMLSLLITGASGLTHNVKNSSFVDEKTNLSAAKESNNIGKGEGVKTDCPEISADIYTNSQTANSTYYYIGFRSTNGEDPSMQDYTLGRYSSQAYYPATISFNFVDKDGTVKSSGTCIATSTATDLLPIGPYYGKYDSIYLGFTVERFADYFIDLNSVFVSNIFKFTVADGKETVDYSSNYNIHAKKAASTKLREFSTTFSAEETKFLGISQYENKLCINNQIAVHDTIEYYKTRKSSKYNKFEEDINSGKVFLRVRLAFSGDTKFMIYTDNVNDGNNGVISLVPTQSYINLSSTGLTSFNFLTEKPLGKILDFRIFNFNIYYGLLRSDSYNEVESGVSVTDSFGLLSFRMADIKNSDGSVFLSSVNGNSTTDINMIILIFTLCFVAVYTGVVVGYYFYSKKKYANDEFRHVVKSKYITQSIYGILFLLPFALTITYILFRATLFANSFTVNNSMDAIIIVMAVISILIGGYWIKYFVTTIKDSIDKKRREKLNMNKDVADDGTK